MDASTNGLGSGGAQKRCQILDRTWTCDPRVFATKRGTVACCFLVLGFDVVDSVENEDSSQIVCTGVVGNTRNPLLAVVDAPSASFREAVLGSGRQIHVV